MTTSARFLRSVLLIFFFLAGLIHFYFNRTTRNPHYGKVFYRLGLECQNKCGLDEQLSYFQKAVFYDPNLTDAYYQLGVIYGKKGQNEKEFLSYERVVTLDHANADAYFEAGLYYFQKGELDHALRYFLQSDRYKQALHDSFYYLARIYENKQKYKEAVSYYKNYIALVGDARFSAEACGRIWRISKIYDQYEMVLDAVNKMRNNKEQEKLWEQIDQYIRTDQMPEFMRKPMEAGTRLN